MNEYKTIDLMFSSVLNALGVKLISSDFIEDNTEMMVGVRRKMEFVFEDDGTIEDLRVKFVGKNLKIDAKTLLEAYQSLKGIIYERSNKD